jgi:hypothetical protein
MEQQVIKTFAVRFYSINAAGSSSARANPIRLGFLLFLATVLPVIPATAADQPLVTVEDQIWGFDGRVQTGQFNPVSVLFDNRSEDAIEAVAALSRLEGLVGTTSGELQQNVFIGPGARRWVQFYAYVPIDDQTEWNLRLGKLKFTPLRQPRSTTAKDNPKQKQKPRPAAVILDAPGSMSRQPTSVKHFPEAIFPPWSTATVGLHTIFMDHTPDWEVPRQEALMSWLRRGGRLQLLKSPRGGWPEFIGAMADLNQPFPRFSVGSGVVERMDIQRADLSEAIVLGLLAVNEEVEEDELPDEELSVNTNTYQNPYMMNQLQSSQLDESWFEQMRQLTQPQHAWGLIYLLAFAYIGLIFPGCWILSRQNRHFLVVYGSIAGLSIVFSLLFLVIGRRGHGESTSLHTLALSRLEGGQQQNILEWDALFVTTGDQYTIAVPDQQALFAIPGLQQRTNAVMTAGNDALLSVAIPPFSSQTFMCRRQQPAPDWQLKVRSVDRSSNGVSSITIETGPKFSSEPDPQYRMLYGREMYRLKLDAEKQSLHLAGSIGSVTKFIKMYFDNDHGGFGWGYYEEVDADGFYNRALEGLIVRSFTEDGVSDVRQVKLPEDRVRLFVYTDLPEDQFVNTHTEAGTRGRILYVCDLPLNPGNSGTSVEQDGQSDIEVPATPAESIQDPATPPSE